MFRKIVSNLAFSPALVGQLGFYAKRLKKEEATRRLGLVVTALALIVQSLTVFTPPESANAANPSDFIRGGVKSKKQVLAEYDRKNSDFKDIMDYAGVTRAELANMHEGKINSKGKGTGAGSWKNWGRVKRFSGAQAHAVPLDTGGSSTVYSRALWWYDSTSYTIPNGSTYAALIGHSAKRGDFAIMKDCGNLITTSTPKPDVAASFISANCDMIRGKAIDGRDKKTRIKVYLYYGGPPGKGEKSAAILTQADNNQFAVKVPEKFRKASSPTKIWGVMVPLAGWHDSTVQFEDTVSIPGGCIKPAPLAACEDLVYQSINRTDFSLTGKSTASGGAKVSAYYFTVKDSSGKVVNSKTVKSTSLQASSGRLSIATAGSYTAQVTVKTSAGDKTNQDCQTTVKIAAPAVPSVGITKKVDGVETKTVAVNGEFTYQIVVSNTGDVDLKNTVVTDDAPSGVTFLSSNVGSIKNNKWSYTVPALKKDTSVKIDIKAKITGYTPASIVNTACVNTPEVNPSKPTEADACDTATVNTPPPVKNIEVCDLASKTMVTIPENEFDASKHSKNPDDCKNLCADNNPACIQVTESKTSKNLTQGVDATTVSARASDRIEYTINLENVGQVPVTRVVSEELSDVAEYAKVIQTGSGTYDEVGKTLKWSDVTLQPGEKTSRSFVVQILPEIPVTARGTSDPSSYDCVMTNAFGNTVNISVSCESPKMVEGAVSELPKTGPGENLLFAGIVAAVVTFFWARSRQLGREVKLIRKDFNTGIM